MVNPDGKHKSKHAEDSLHVLQIFPEKFRFADLILCTNTIFTRTLSLEGSSSCQTSCFNL